MANVCTVYVSIINCDVFGVRKNGGKIHGTLTPQVLWSKLPENLWSLNAASDHTRAVCNLLLSHNSLKNHISFIWRMQWRHRRRGRACPALRPARVTFPSTDRACSKIDAHPQPDSTPPPLPPPPPPHPLPGSLPLPLSPSWSVTQLSSASSPASPRRLQEAGAQGTASHGLRAAAPGSFGPQQTA